MKKRSQVMWAFAFGCVFVCAFLILALFVPNPAPYQYQTFRIVMALAAAGVAAMIPGFLKVEIDPTLKVKIRAGGALGVFAVVYFFNPARLTERSEGGGSNPRFQQIAASSNSMQAGRDVNSYPQNMVNSPGGVQAGRDINILSNVNANPTGARAHLDTAP